MLKEIGINPSLISAEDNDLNIDIYIFWLLVFQHLRNKIEHLVSMICLVSLVNDNVLLFNVNVKSIILLSYIY